MAPVGVTVAAVRDRERFHQSTTESRRDLTELLGFRLLPRLKNIGSIRLYRPDDTTTAAGTYAHLGDVVTRPIRWELIARTGAGTR